MLCPWRLPRRKRLSLDDRPGIRHAFATGWRNSRSIPNHARGWNPPMMLFTDQSQAIWSPDRAELTQNGSVATLTRTSTFADTGGRAPMVVGWGDDEEDEYEGFYDDDDDEIDDEIDDDDDDDKEEDEEEDEFADEDDFSDGDGDGGDDGDDDDDGGGDDGDDDDDDYLNDGDDGDDEEDS